MKDFSRYVGAVHSARRARADTRFSVALLDIAFARSNAFAAYKHWVVLGGAAPSKDIELYSYNTHEGGAAAQNMVQPA